VVKSYLDQNKNLEQHELVFFEEIGFDKEIVTNLQDDFLGQFNTAKTVHFTVLLSFLSNGQKLPLFVISDAFDKVEK